MHLTARNLGKEQATETAAEKPYLNFRVSQAFSLLFSSLLLQQSDPDMEVFWFHEPVVLAGPFTVRMLQLEIEVAHDLWYYLQHLEIGDVPTNACPRSQTELRMSSE